MGLRRMGVSTRDLLHEYARKSYIYDFRDKLVCCKFDLRREVKDLLLTLITELLVCTIYPHCDE
jgi:hypothetical protein